MNKRKYITKNGHKFIDLGTGEINPIIGIDPYGNIYKYDGQVTRHPRRKGKMTNIDSA